MISNCSLFSMGARFTTQFCEITGMCWAAALECEYFRISLMHCCSDHPSRLVNNLNN